MRVRCCRRVMKTVASERARAGCNRAHVRVMPAALLKAAVVKAVAVRQRGPRGPVTVQIDFDGLSQRIVSVPGVPERQYSDLQAGVDGQVFYLEAGRTGGSSAPGSAEAATNCCAIVCAIVVRTRLSVTLPDTRSAPIVASSFIAQQPAVADSLVVQAAAVERHRLRSCSSSMPIEHHHNRARVV